MQMGPESRIQPRSVGMRKKSTAARWAPDFLRMVRTRDSASRFSTRRQTRSTWDRWRTISAKAQRMGENLPGQSVSSWGQLSQAASWTSHSAGILKPRDGGVEFVIEEKDLAQRAQRTQRAGRRENHSPSQRLGMGWYASMRRSRRNGQLRRVSSLSAGSHSTTKISSLSLEASERMRPKGSATKEFPQNSRPASPFSSFPSKPTRLTTAT